MTDPPTESRFDPRFNPVFQPGYDPSVQARHPGSPDVPADAGVTEAASEPRLTVAASDLESTPAAPSSPAGPAAAVDRPESTDRSDPVTGRRRFDPFLSALWALSLTFVGAGLVMVRLIADRIDRLSNTAGATSFDFSLVMIYTIATPLLVVLGLATGTGTIFLLATRRRSR